MSAMFRKTRVNDLCSVFLEFTRKVGSIFTMLFHADMKCMEVLENA